MVMQDVVHVCLETAEAEGGFEPPDCGRAQGVVQLDMIVYGIGGLFAVRKAGHLFAERNEFVCQAMHLA
jgi:hypothetical protein